MILELIQIHFQEGSRELEAELETQLEQSEKKCKEFRLFNSRLTMETEQLRDKLEQAQREHHCQVCKNYYAWANDFGTDTEEDETSIYEVVHR